MLMILFLALAATLGAAAGVYVGCRIGWNLGLDHATAELRRIHRQRHPEAYTDL